VPQLTPNAHWKFGLQVNSDSHVFHENAVRVAQNIRDVGWRSAESGSQGGLSHTTLIAAVYYLTGYEKPYPIYVLEAGIFALNGLLLLAVLQHSSGLPLGISVIAVLILCLSPMMLFVHSELLREPFAILGALLFVYGLLELGRPHPEASRHRSLILNGSATALGFVVLTGLRSYLLFPLLLPIAAMLFVLAFWPVFTRTTQARPQEFVTLAALTVLLLLFYVAPQSAAVQQYSDASVLDSPGAADVNDRSIDAWKEQFVRSAGSSARLDREAVLAPHSCTVVWKPTGWLPESVDKKLEGLSCAREDFLRFCDQALLGRHADRFCDEAEFSGATAIIRHLPRALVFGLFTPYPRMWLDDFGSGGTGLRRVGYVVDGVTAYLMLPGLFGILLGTRKRPHVTAVALSLMAITTICALAIPSQFILARIRLALFWPLLALGFVGWMRLVSPRFALALENGVAGFSSRQEVGADRALRRHLPTR
jgi:hypothetical protein